MWIDCTFVLLTAKLLKFLCICRQIAFGLNSNLIVILTMEHSRRDVLATFLLRNVSWTLSGSISTHLQTKCLSDRAQMRKRTRYGTHHVWLIVYLVLSNSQHFMASDVWNNFRAFVKNADLKALELVKRTHFRIPHHWRSIAGPIGFWLHSAGSLIWYVAASKNPSLGDIHGFTDAVIHVEFHDLIPILS